MNKSFIKKVMGFIFIFISFFSVKVYSSVLSAKLILNQKQEELIDGGSASQSYMFNIFGNKAFLEIKTWHSMYSCDGNYVVTNKGGVIYLSWDASANGNNYFCDYPSPQFKIKIKNNNFYLNSELLNGEGEWYLMTEK